MTSDKSYRLLANYNAYGPKISTIVDEILAHGDLDFQIPSSVPYQGTNLKGCTALHVAIEHKDYETFQKLIDSGADFTVKNDRDISVLHLAVEYCMELSEESRKFIDSVLSAHVEFNVTKNPQDGNGMSHFHVACMMNRVDAVEMFLNNGASVDGAVNNSDSTRFSGYTALHFAAEYCCLQTVKLLLDRGANIGMKSANGLTALHPPMLQKMKILNWKNMGSRAPWGKLKAELETNAQMIDLFVEKWDAQSGDVLNDSDLSYFHVACTFEDTSRVAKLMEKSVDLEHRVAADSPLWPGYTALHFAARCNPETVVLLLENGADFLAKDASGVTPLDLCLQRYEVDYLHRFVSLESALQNVTFSDGTTRLIDALLAMKNEKTLSDFIDKIADINMSLQSSFWAGYTLLHLATSLPERINGFEVVGKFMHADSSEKVDDQYNCSQAGEALYIDRIKVCLSRGASVDIRGSHDSTPLHHAYRVLRGNAVDYLLKNHESLENAVDKDNLTHLYIACVSGNEGIIEKLLSKSADHVNRALSDESHFAAFGKKTPLHIAVSSGRKTMVTLLLNRDADRYARDADGMTPIHYAFVESPRADKKPQSYRDVASALLFADELRECETSFGLSHLHVASFANNVTAIEKLLISGANTEATIRPANAPGDKLKILLKSVDGFTPLHLALKYDCKEAVAALIRCQANFLAVPSKIGFELHQKHSDFLASTLMNDLVSQQPIRDAFGLTQLHAACATLNVARAMELIRQGADPNVQVNADTQLWAGNTPLHFVLIRRDGYPPKKISLMLKLLLKFRADVTLKNSNNETPLLSAFYLFPTDATSLPLLLQILKSQRNFMVNPVDNEGWSHFHLACFYDQTAVVEKYIENGVDVNQPVDYLSRKLGGSRPIHIAANRKCNDTLELLLKHGADVHVRNITGRTPIHEAVDFNHRMQTIPFPVGLDRTPYKSLLEAGADEKSLTHWGESAFEILLKSQKITSEVCPDYVEGNINLFNSLTDEGYIAMAIAHELNADTLSENLVYQALINHPEKHVFDELGRTPIHNVVSMWPRRTPLEVYVKVIEQLDLNFDIDQQDSKGRTALHMAIKFCNWRAAGALLIFGSDINVMDINRETPLSYLSKLYGKRRFVDLNEDERFLVSACLGHMFRLRSANIHISKTNEDISATFVRIAYKSTRPWEDEVTMLKTKHIDGLEMTLWEFLSETRAIPSYPSMRQLKRKTIDDFFKNDRTTLRNKFRLSAGLLQLQYRKAAKRSTLLKRAKNSLDLLVDCTLPDLCCDLVLMYLNQEELEHLIKTGILDEQSGCRIFSDVSQSVAPFVGVEPMQFFAVK